jgi:putative ABC transport system ATP-binding protein
MPSIARGTSAPEANYDAALEVAALSKVYGTTDETKTYALQDVSFRVEHGEFVAIIGPSGSGKTTLLNLIGALDRPTSGKVMLDGVDISRLSSADLAGIRNRKLGFVFQSFNLIGRMTAAENVEVPLMVMNVPPKKRRERSTELLAQFGLSSRLNHRPNQLSGGEQQRVAVARALATDPTLLLGDEPTGNLDTKNTAEVMRILKQLNKQTGKTLVIITHNLEIAEKADRIISLLDGRVEKITTVKHN